MSSGDFDRTQTASPTAETESGAQQHDDAPASDDTRFNHDGPYPPVVTASSAPTEHPPSASERAHGDAQPKKPVDAGEIKVKVAAVDLKTGEPRTAILEAVTQVAVSWNLMISNMTTAVEQFVQTIGHAEFKKADSGLMETIWSTAEKWLTKAAECVSGTALAPELGITAIKKILDKGAELEQKRVQADEDAFVRDLRESTKSAQLDGVREGGNMHIHKIVDKLDGDFLAAGTKAEKGDAWKRGDRAVIGAQADFLQDLQHKADDYTNNVPTTADFAGDFFVSYVQTNHKKRKRSAWRSPFADPEYQDGYVGLDLELMYDEARLGWYIAGSEGATGQLHAPKSKDVAEALAETHPNLNLWDLNLPVTINLTIADNAKERLPEHFRSNPPDQIQIIDGVADAQSKPFWDLVTRESRTSTQELLYRVRKLKG